MAFVITFWKSVVIHLILIVVVVALTLYIQSESTQYNCEKCNVTLEWWHRFGAEEQVKYTMEIPIQKVYEGFLEGRCPLVWDIGSGFIYEGESALEIKNG